MSLAKTVLPLESGSVTQLLTKFTLYSTYKILDAYK